jgi:hypothetical protein
MTPNWQDIASGYRYGIEQLPLRVDDFIPETDLSIAQALARIPEADRQSYAALYSWFQQNTGTVGSRFTGKRLPGVAFAHAAQRGIHAPSQRDYAVTVTVKRNSLYESGSDGQRFDLGDGTWVVYYSAHRNNTGGQTQTIWNQKLLNCMVDGVPVGLFLQTGSKSDSYMRALVFVEEYDPETDLFTLHGPVTAATERLFRSSYAGAAANPGNAGQPQQATLPEMQTDNRSFAVAKQAVRQGQQQFRQQLVRAYDGRCAVTGMRTNKVLQAAHILDYRGTQSNAVQNGLLLRSDIHLLFDNYLIGINPSGYRIEVADVIQDPGYAALDGKQLILPTDKAQRPNEQYLAAKYERYRCA